MGLVFLGEGYRRLAHVRFQVGEYLEKVLTAIAEDAFLYVHIAFLCIVVEAAQLSLCAVVIPDILVQLVIAAFQRAQDVYGECKTHVAVDGGTFGKRAVVHGTQHIHQRVESGYLCDRLVEVVLKRNHRLPELMVHLCGLMARIGEVEDIAALLRIEHQRVLAALIDDRIHVRGHRILLVLHKSRLPFQLYPIVGQFFA